MRNTVDSMGMASMAGLLIGAAEWLQAEFTIGFRSLCWTAAAYALISALVALGARAAERAWPRLGAVWLWISFWLGLYGTIWINVTLLPRQSFRTWPSIAMTACLLAAVAIVSSIIAWLLQ